MRADRLVSLVLLLRQRGRMTADALAAELEVSPRTVLRDIEALSTAGVPVYAERGRHGGFALLPGFRTELTGLNHDEALALLTAGSGSGERAFGLGSALASAMRKVVDALPEGHRVGVGDASQRLLVEPETDLLSRRQTVDEVSKPLVAEVRRAVLAGRRLHFAYAAPGRATKSHTVDPIGLVTVRGHTYLLALRDGEDRTFRLSRIIEVEVLADAARRPARVDLDRLWRDRAAQFLSEDHLRAVIRIVPACREALLEASRAVLDERQEPDGRLRLEVMFEDLRHATWAVWQLGADAEALAPQALRTGLRDRAAALVDRYGDLSGGP
ncbi:helix-turn-helix transcriptional regulator [Mariniluteicoccus flavus]